MNRSSGWTVDESKREEVLGYKLSLGLEVLASRYRVPGQHQQTESALEHLIKKLQSVGYFQGTKVKYRLYQKFLKYRLYKNFLKHLLYKKFLIVKNVSSSISH